MNRALVLLSGGLDSTVNLYAAKSEFDELVALHIDYGQRARRQEKERAKQLCQKLEVPLHILELPWMSHWSQSSLTDTSKNIPSGEEVAIDDKERSLQTARSVWVPNRNGVFLNIAAALAESLGAQAIIPGFNKEEATTFPDNSLDFMTATTAAMSFSTANQVEVRCFTVDMNKSEIVNLGRRLGVDFDLVWPCYLDGESPCGKCESCQRFYRAMEAR